MLSVNIMQSLFRNRKFLSLSQFYDLFIKSRTKLKRSILSSDLGKITQSVVSISSRYCSFCST